MRPEGIRKKKPKSIMKRDDWQAYLLILPFFLVFTLFTLYPIIKNVIDSLTNANSLTAQREFVLFENYTKLFTDPDFLIALKNTVVYALFSVLPLTVLGFIAAVAVNRPLRLIKTVRGLLIFPYITSMTAVSMIWLYLLDPSAGFINKILDALGIDRLMWLFDERLALPSLIFINVWKNVGYVMLVYLAGLSGIPPHIYEAARVDGAGAFRMVKSITLPMVYPTTFFLFITLTIESFKTFEQVRIMTDGGPIKTTTTLVYLIYRKAFLEYNTGYAAAIAVVLLVLVAVVTLINMRLGRRDAP